MIDPRTAIIKKRLENISVYAIASSKGGVGKSLISTLMALSIRDKGIETGLLDIDFTNPSCHILLDVNYRNNQPIEEYGVIPPKVNGIRFMSILYYTFNNPLALRGEDIDNVIKELLAITRWRDVNILIIDTPPGLSDEFLDLITYIPNLKIAVVTTPYTLSLKSVNRMIKLLKENGIQPIGIIENMSAGTENVRRFAEENMVPYLGNIPFIENLEIIFNQSGIKTVYMELKKYLDNIIENIRIS